MKKTILVLTMISVSIFNTSSILAQTEKMIGLWMIEKVAMGNQQMTPVARWTRIQADGRYQSGNGWLQSASGTWSFDKEKKIFSASDALDIADEFGGFEVAFKNDKMIWRRMEEGSWIEVTLIPIKELPMAPADYLEGLWDLIEITKNGNSILKDFDPSNQHKIQIRWDRIYRNFNPKGGQTTGYWHIHGHKSEVTFLPHQQDGTVETWRIKVDEKSLQCIGISDSNKGIIKKYQRIKSF